MLAIFDEKIEIRERKRCKGVHCLDLGESFQTHINLQNFVSIQPRTSTPKICRKLIDKICRKSDTPPPGTSRRVRSGEEQGHAGSACLRGQGSAVGRRSRAEVAVARLSLRKRKALWPMSQFRKQRCCFLQTALF